MSLEISALIHPSLGLQRTLYLECKIVYGDDGDALVIVIGFIGKISDDLCFMLKLAPTGALVTMTI